MVVKLVDGTKIGREVIHGFVCICVSNTSLRR